MKIIYLRGIKRNCSTAMRCLYASLSLAFLGLFGSGMLWLGYQLGVRDVKFPQHQLVSALQHTFDEQNRLLKDAEHDAQNRIDALSLRIGELQSHLLRLDALGERLVNMGHLDKGEFDFSEPPALGGPEVSEAGSEATALPGLTQELEQLQQEIASREQQLNLMQDLIMHANLDETLYPAGRPIKKGWISSYFGMRNDPFTGKRAMHKGMDFAGKLGSDVVAVAAGVVTWAGERSGYGKLIEINHGKGYVTRYGHNQKVLVEIGDRVKQGQVIGAMGSSGRSTGPHVHFEVLRNGRQVDPAQYIHPRHPHKKA